MRGLFFFPKVRVDTMGEVYFCVPTCLGRFMKRFILLTGICVLAAGCAYDPATGEFRLVTREVSDADSVSDSLQHNLAVQRYMREHRGKMPPPDYPIYP